MDVIINLLVNGISTGLLIFLLAAGLTLIFGLMDVLNFAHGGLFVWGAFMGAWVFNETGNFLLSVAAAILIGMVLGLVLERFLIRPVYGNHVRQLLITLGGMLVLTESIKILWGPNPIRVNLPEWLQGSFQFDGGVILIKYRLFVIVVGIIMYAALWLLLSKTRIGLMIRAGVIDKEMVQAMGINVKAIFTFVFLLGSAMAAMGGALLAPYSGVVFAEMGMQYAILAFIVVIIGGMGSLQGSALASLIVGVLGAFMAYYIPDLSLALNMLLLAFVLLVKPTGLMGEKGGAV
ncbi:branched-chain amino acid ABC transporter permease [Rossellomorea marisflavi]|jgi:branched-chain amino acid transport system permease protein|uniref:Branched-chain amino acid ABC transporter permease n=1 Tax=Rossellomorea marisflavi TaxID=189381 RepID=A0A5D4S3L0_9BACI|nr:branched-chain amino acid ABC transporter permease [Rossellomorea marisflavi]KQU59621.1 ABC transporter permease [Bacillus sp. Leaf406]VXC10244.1 ABC transporter permease [Bacillus sp. 349Y]MDR4936323.1 branched-chain amino acid ABC transporter permease [Rossellomorea marisflavi]TYS56758.1 branched-chain amino acid ABC transporter permease [Rossellomorea marisflavi]WJV20371.1 branched-chain amino acid ABC transporter permease [Rossellomorea marisflavi]